MTIVVINTLFNCKKFDDQCKNDLPHYYIHNPNAYKFQPLLTLKKSKDPQHISQSCEDITKDGEPDK